MTAQKTYIIGVDIGTTAVKAVVMDECFSLVSKSSIEYPIYSPKMDWAEQDPDEVVSAVFTSIKDSVIKSGIPPVNISAVSFSAAMHSVICMDVNGKPLTRAVIWADNRAGGYVDILKRDYGGHEIYMRTGTPIHPMSPLLKIMWFKDNELEIFAKTAKFISIKEYFFLQLFNEYYIDYSVASATGLFNLKNLAWDTGALGAAGINESQLSQAVPTTSVYYGISTAAAEKMGLLTDTKFVIGASDGPLSNIGVGAVSKGEAALTIGTSGAIRTITDKPVTDEKERTFCYAITENAWLIGGPVNNGGIVFQWIRDQLCTAETEEGLQRSLDPYQVIYEKIKDIPAGSDGLLFHPYFTGERAPIWNSDARGSFVGLTMAHTREHMINAVLEGIMYNLNDVLEGLQDLMGCVKIIKASGGFVRSEKWMQITADIFGKRLTVPESYESACIGAGMLALLTLGKASDLEKVSHQIKDSSIVEPDTKNMNVYRQLIPIYRNISKALIEAGIYKDISYFQRTQTKQ